MCLISRWPASRGDHLFIVERALCVISRYPFFDFLSFLLRNVAEHDRAWMTERLSKLQVCVRVRARMLPACFFREPPPREPHAPRDGCVPRHCTPCKFSVSAPVLADDFCCLCV
jgi:hypothetical protein